MNTTEEVQNLGLSHRERTALIGTIFLGGLLETFSRVEYQFLSAQVA